MNTFKIEIEKVDNGYILECPYYKEIYTDFRKLVNEMAELFDEEGWVEEGDKETKKKTPKGFTISAEYVEEGDKETKKEGGRE